MNDWLYRIECLGYAYLEDHTSGETGWEGEIDIEIRLNKFMPVSIPLNHNCQDMGKHELIYELAKKFNTLLTSCGFRIYVKHQPDEDSIEDPTERFSEFSYKDREEDMDYQKQRCESEKNQKSHRSEQ